MTATAPAGTRANLAGTATLLRFAARRDRVRLPVWIAAVAGSVVATAAAFPDLYPDAAARQARAELMTNPAAVALGGPGIGLEDYTLGAMMTNEMLGYAALAVALMSIFLVVRHTRADEAAGRTELVRAAVVGRHAPLAAAALLAVGANVVLGAAVGAGLAGLGIESIDPAGAALYGAALTGVGLVFAALATVTAQLTGSARAASGLAGVGLGLAFTLRAVGDVGSATWLSWLSPVAWAQRTAAFVDDRWWPLLPALATAVVLTALALALEARRDLGAGVLPARPGAARASDRLVTPLGLTVRLQRPTMIGWAAALALFGLVYGSLIGEVETFGSELAAVSDVLAGLGDTLIDAFLALIVSALAMTAAIFAAGAVLRAGTEERAGRAEPVIATGVSRTRWLAGYGLVGAVGGTLVLLVACVGMALGGMTTTGDVSLLPRMVGAGLVQATALLFVVGLSLALVGWVPRAAGLVWVVLAAALVGGMLGGLIGLPQWVLDLSPFAIAPRLPADAFSWAPVTGLLLGAAALAALGLLGIRRRDLR